VTAPKLGQSQRKLAVAAHTVTEHEAVARARHRLESDRPTVVIEEEHVLGVVPQVPRALEELGGKELRREYLLIAAGEALSAHEVDQLVVDVHAAR